MGKPPLGHGHTFGHSSGSGSGSGVVGGAGGGADNDEIDACRYEDEVIDAAHGYGIADVFAASAAAAIVGPPPGFEDVVRYFLSFPFLSLMHMRCDGVSLKLALTWALPHCGIGERV